MHRILLTGAKGFLGKYLSEALKKQHSISELSRSYPSDIVCDLSKDEPLLSQSFDVVIHAAGKAHVTPKSLKDEQDFFQTNVIGTQNLLKGLEESKGLPRSFIFVSSVSVYGLSKGEKINETHPLNARDAYGRSKIEVERLLKEWCIAHHVSLTILRLPLIVGKNPPGNLKAMVSGIKNGRYLSIDRGRARKSMVLAEDVAAIIPAAIEKSGIYHLTDGHHPSFAELEAVVARSLKAKPPINISPWVAYALGFFGTAMDLALPGKSLVTITKIEKILSTLTFDDQKARLELGWNPRKVIDVFSV